MSKEKYRIVTDGKVFRIELYQSWTYRAGWFWLKTVKQEQWVVCDNIGGDCLDDDGWEDESEMVEYDTLKEAQDQIKEWTTEPVIPPAPTWKTVWEMPQRIKMD